MAQSPAEPRKEHVEILLPGFIEASNEIQFGAPCLVKTRIPFYVGLGWVWECLSDVPSRKVEGLTRENIIALAAFHAGYEWHRKRKRRKDMTLAVRELWEGIAAQAKAEAEGRAL
ncbi:MAG: hypothetical protein U0990_12750 [Candidatus Nanopelagicales bacterium]|nr:hypothetical protein [Candidatus Nanopelagicales bacterium]